MTSCIKNINVHKGNGNFNIDIENKYLTIRDNIQSILTNIGYRYVDTYHCDKNCIHINVDKVESNERIIGANINSINRIMSLNMCVSSKFTIDNKDINEHTYCIYRNIELVPNELPEFSTNKQNTYIDMQKDIAIDIVNYIIRNNKS